MLLRATTPFGSRKKKRLPSPTLLSADSWQMLKTELVLRYFSMIPLQLSSPKPCPFSEERCGDCTSPRTEMCEVKSLDNVSSSIPQPVSLTEISTK